MTAKTVLPLFGLAVGLMVSPAAIDKAVAQDLFIVSGVCSGRSSA